MPASAIWDLQLTYPSGDVQTIVSGAGECEGRRDELAVLAGTYRG